MSDKKYVPEGWWVSCDKGTCPSQLRVSHDNNTTIFSVPLASDADKLPYFNIKPIGLCVFRGLCIPSVIKWQKVKDDVEVNGNKLLTEESFAQCLYSGKLELHETREAAAKACIVDMPDKSASDYLKDGFNWIFDKVDSFQEYSDGLLKDMGAPDWVMNIKHGIDNYVDLQIGITEGVLQGAVGTVEGIAGIIQDPVGTVEAVSGLVEKGYDWAKNGDNWKNAADWATNPDNWEKTGSEIADWASKQSPRDWGNIGGQVAFEVGTAVLTVGGSEAATAAKAADKIADAAKVSKTARVVDKLADLGKAAKRIPQVVAKKAEQLLGKKTLSLADDAMERATNLMKKCLNDPVDPVTGNVLYPYTDFELPGPIPIQWKREYNSGSNYQGLLGYGVSSVFDLHLSVVGEKEKIKINLADGNIVYFAYPEEGEIRYHIPAKLHLSLKNNIFYLFDYQNRWLYTYSEQEKGNYKPIKIEDERGFNIQLHYLENKLYRIIDSRKQTLEISSDYRGNICKITIPTPTENRLLVEYEYDEDGNMVAAYDSLKQKTTIEYDTHHRMVKKTDRNGQSFYWKYNAAGKCVHTWGDSGLQEGFFEYLNGKTLYKDSTQISQTFYYDKRCRITQEEDAFGNSKYYEYDEKDNLIKEVDEEGLETLHSYDELGNLTKTEFPDESTYTFAYDDENRLILATDPSGNHTKWTYYKNRLHSMEKEGKSTRFLYNEQNLIATVRNHWEEETHLQYDDQLNLVEMVSPLKQITRWKYNTLGECTEIINPLGKKQDFQYDRLGRLTKVKLPNTEIIDLKYDAYDSVLQVNSLHSKINYTYTPLGSILSREEKGIKVFFEYDVQERLTALSNEKGEKYKFERNQRGDIIREISFDGITKYYNRDKAGKVIRIKRGANRFTEYEYDKGGRIIRAQYHDGTWETFAYNKAGLLVEARNSKNCITFKRNSEGKIIQEQQGEHCIEYLYDKNDNLTHIQSSLGGHINYTRDSFGLVTGIQAGEKENPWVAEIKRNMLGLEIERTLPGGVKSSWNYDDNNNPVSQKVESSLHKTGLHKNYHWNASQQLQQITNALTKGVTTFDYDAFNNLASAQYEDGSHEYKLPDEIGNLFRDPTKTDKKYDKGGKLIQDKEQYLYYDAEGNLILKTRRKNPVVESIGSSGSTLSFWLDDEQEKKSTGFWIDEKESSSSLYSNIFDEKAEIRSYSKKERQEYDKHRGRNEDGTPREPQWESGDWGYEWYANGMLKTVTTPEGKKINFEYDALGRRTAKIVGNKIYRYLWEGNVLLHEWNYPLVKRPYWVANSEGEIQYNRPEPVENLISWIYDDGALVPTARIEEGQTHSIISDYIGRPVQVYNEQGECVWETEYDIYGNLRNLKGNRDLIPFRQLGQYEDKETGLYYNRFRYYNPETGAYISQDPIGIEGNNPNLYAYVSDSNTFVDVFGLMECKNFFSGSLKDMPFTAKLLNPLKQGTKAWNDAVKAAKEAISEGRKFQVKTATKSDADAFLREINDGKGMNRYRNGTQSRRPDGTPKYEKGYEVHQQFKERAPNKPKSYPELGGKQDGVYHLKYYMEGTDGHIFFETF